MSGYRTTIDLFENSCPLTLDVHRTKPSTGIFLESNFLYPLIQAPGEGLLTISAAQAMTALVDMKFQTVLRRTAFRE